MTGFRSPVINEPETALASSCVRSSMIRLAAEYGGEPMTTPADPGENLLLLAHRAIADKQDFDAAKMTADFDRLFVVTAPPPTGKTQAFERFSLVNPNIRTVIRANTAGA